MLLILSDILLLQKGNHNYSNSTSEESTDLVEIIHLSFIGTTIFSWRQDGIVGPVWAIYLSFGHEWKFYDC